MNHGDSQCVVPSVRLFPRLATTDTSGKPKRLPRRNVGQHSQPATDGDRRDAAHKQVRARLLRMILENERIRRHEQRPSAS